MVTTYDIGAAENTIYVMVVRFPFIQLVQSPEIASYQRFTVGEAKWDLLCGIA